MSLENEIVLVTGASRGIGQAVALELGAQGATVIGTATSAGSAEKISAAFAERRKADSGGGRTAEPRPTATIFQTSSKRHPERI